jgi:DNA helicase-2/ATP-dependent DNA helicase PcrA
MQLLPGIGPALAQRVLDAMADQPSPLRALANIRAPSRTGDSWGDFVQTLRTISAGTAGWPAEIAHAHRWYEPHL